MKLIATGVGCLIAGTAAATLAPGQAPKASAADSRTVDVRLVATATYEASTDTPLATTSDGDMPIARTAVGEQARSVLSLDVPASATAGRVTIAVQTRADQEYGSPAISLCPLTARWRPGAGQSLAAAPAYDCNKIVAVGVTATTVSFDLGPALAYWRAGHPVLGLALVMDAPTVAPEKVVLNAIASQVVGRASLPTSPPQPAANEGGEAPPTSPPAAPPSPLATPGSAPAIPDPVDLTSAAQPGFAPVLAPSPATTPVAAVASGPLPVPGAAWFLLPGGVLLLAGIGRTLSQAGDPLLADSEPASAVSS